MPPGAKGRARYDVCVAGTGPAGVAVALALAEARPDLRVVVLDGSSPGGPAIVREDFDFTAGSPAQSLYDGEVEGWVRRGEPRYLTRSRVHARGGTTSVWSGWCWPLEPHDLVARPGRPMAWPLTAREMAPWNAKASRVLGLADAEFEGDRWAARVFGRPAPEALFDDADLRTRVLQVRPSNVWRRLGRRLRALPRVEILDHTVLCRVEPREGRGGALHGVRVRRWTGHRPGAEDELRARHVVLATGALEATRILLASGLGRDLPWLGRGLMEHPYAWHGGCFELGRLPPALHAFHFADRPPLRRGGWSILPAVVARPSLLARERIGGFRLLFGGDPSLAGRISLSWEQPGDPNNRVELAEDLEPDAFGVPRLRVRLGLGAMDHRTARVALTVAAEKLTALGYARDVRLPDLDRGPADWPAPWRVTPGSHPMGTTRMARDRADGVVDEHCRVHGVDGLHVASASVFPTGGYANPTLSVVALALRLADRLAA
jgi:choline dehydrogenase-like flavoprotein